MKKRHIIYLATIVLAITIVYTVYATVSDTENYVAMPSPTTTDVSSEQNNSFMTPNATATETKQPASADPKPTSVPQTTTPTDQQKLEQHINQLVQTMTLQQKIGQLLILGIEDKDATVSKQTAQLIEEQGIGNIILFKRNIKNNTQLSSLIQNLKKLPHEQEVPLWISIDQEGGIVNRLPQKFPSAQHWAELDDATATEQAGQDIGETLTELSIDVNFAPVLDINNNPDNPVIGSRAFGSNAPSVVKHGMAMLDGLDDYVITVGKHFPGHGDTNVDSHHSLPVIQKNWAELEQLELIPFRAAIEEGIDAIMIGHLYLPQIDEHYPASLSPTIINYYLREELGFEGLIMTDDLVMGGITENYEIGEAAVLALQAGNTMLIVGHQPKQQQAVIQALIAAVEEGILNEDMIDECVALVLRMKMNTLSNFPHN